MHGMKNSKSNAVLFWGVSKFSGARVEAASSHLLAISERPVMEPRQWDGDWLLPWQRDRFELIRPPIRRGPNVWAGGGPHGVVLHERSLRTVSERECHNQDSEPSEPSDK